MKTSEFSGKESSHRQPAAQATGPQVSQRAVADIDSSPRMQLQRQEIEASFGQDAVQRQTARQEEEVSQKKASLASEPLNATGMPNQLKAGIESLSGMDLSDVRVHANSDKPAQLSALAYAQGNDIHLGPGQEQHLPHEAWHVVQQRQGRVQPTLQMAGVAVNDDAALEEEADAMGVKATTQLKSRDQGPEEGTFARLAQSPGAAGALGLVQDSPSHADAMADGGGVFQLVKWESHGAKKFNAVWYFKDAESARTALTTELGAFAESLKDTDWPLALEFATKRDEGADSALKLLHGTAEENLRRARIKERRDAVNDAGLRDGVDDLGLSAIATAALKLGLDLYIEGNLNGGIGNSWTKTQVNAAIDEVDGGENYEIVGIEDQQDDDTRTGIVIRDVHKATDKAAQGKGSVYRGSDVQANINMKVFGRLVQVHLNVG